LEYLRSSGIKDLLQQARERSGNDEILRHFETFVNTPNVDSLVEGLQEADQKDDHRKSSFFSWLTQNQDGSDPSQVVQERGAVLATGIGDSVGGGLPVRIRRSQSESPLPKKTNTENLRKYFSGGTRRISVFQIRRSLSSSDAKDFLGEQPAESKADPTLEEVFLLFFLLFVEHNGLLLSLFYSDLFVVVQGFPEKRFFRAVEDGNLEELRECVALDKANPLPGQITDIDLRNEQGFTALHLVSVHGLKDIATFLLEKRAEVTKKTRHGATALHLSSQYNQVEIVQLLLRHRDTDANAVDLNGNAPLHMACSNGHVEPARLLLQSRANHLFKNLRGETPLHLACKWGSEAIVELLIQEGKKTGKGTGVNEVTREGNTPLHLTTSELLGHTLLKNGAKLTLDLFLSLSLSFSALFLFLRF